MDTTPAPTSPTAPAPPVLPIEPDLRAEVRGTLLLFLLTVLVTAGVALCANLVVSAVG